jgi:hypothetical protein
MVEKPFFGNRLIECIRRTFDPDPRSALLNAGDAMRGPGPDLGVRRGAQAASEALFHE